MRKIISILAIISILVCLVGCGENSAGDRAVDDIERGITDMTNDMQRGMDNLTKDMNNGYSENNMRSMR